jgi:hypothetical protein
LRTFNDSEKEEGAEAFVKVPAKATHFRIEITTRYPRHRLDIRVLGPDDTSPPGRWKTLEIPSPEPIYVRPVKDGFGLSGHLRFANKTFALSDLSLLPGDLFQVCLTPRPLGLALIFDLKSEQPFAGSF